MNSSPSPVEFNSEDTNRWRSRQEDPFAAQNRLAAAEKAAAEAKKAAARSRSKRRAIVLIAAAAVLVIAIIGIVITAVVNNSQEPVAVLPTFELVDDNEDVTTIDVEDYFAQLKQIYYASDNIEDVKQAVDEALSSPIGAAQTSQIYLAELTFNFWLGNCQEVIEQKDKVNLDNLGIIQLALYYSEMQYCYYVSGDEQQAEFYSVKAMEYNNAASMITGSGGA